jgi:tRNA G18 (ribose-2'-O)-methylase SpoU
LIVINNSQNAQRKYIPSLALDEHTTASNLIVIGSLIDKVTNLGGLARTCQVFGASTFVVDNLSCVEKKEFTALSMTAEKHQHIIEVLIFFFFVF